MKKYIKYTLATVVVALALVGWIALNKQTQSNVVKIGVFTPLTGEAASYGDAMKKGLDLAAEDINAKGGILGKRVELVYEDTRLDSKASVSAMNKFITVDHMPIVIAAEGSGATSAAAPLADANKTLMMVAIASTPQLKDAGDYVFRVVPSDDYQGMEIARLAKSKGYKKVAVLHVNDAYGVGIKDVFSKNFIDGSTMAEQFESDAKDFRTQLIKIKAFNPNAIVVVARKEYPVIFKQIHELNINAQVITSETFKDASLVTASGNNAEGTLVPYFAKATDYVGFAEKYKNKYGVGPAELSDFGYDALGVIAEAANQVNRIDATVIKDALYKVDYKGATGEVRFDSNGEVTEKPFIFYQVKRGILAEIK